MLLMNEEHLWLRVMGQNFKYFYCSPRNFETWRQSNVIFISKTSVRFFQILVAYNKNLYVINCVVRMTVFFSAAQTSCAFRSAHILLQAKGERKKLRCAWLHYRKKINNFVAVEDNDIPFGIVT